jgi:predicted ester cyclase
MSEDLKTKFRPVVDEAWNRGNLDVLDELHSAEYIEHHSPFPDIEGLEAFKQMIAGVRRAYPDFHLTIHDLINEGDKLAVRWSWKGTHSRKSPMLKIPPTGKQVTVNGSHILHSHQGKLIEGWQISDDLGLLQQLGVVPPYEVT